MYQYTYSNERSFITDTFVSSQSGGRKSLSRWEGDNGEKGDEYKGSHDRFNFFSFLIKILMYKLLCYYLINKYLSAGERSCFLIIFRVWCLFKDDNIFFELKII